MLSFIFTARYPQFVKKLILIGSGPYEKKYAASITKTRINRLGNEDWKNFVLLTETLNNPSAKKRNEVLCNFGKLMSKVNTYDPLPYKDEVLECNYDSFKSVWEEASELRSRGELLELGKEIRCQVVAIHGDYDPHPFEGVKEPLLRILKDFRFITLGAQRVTNTPFFRLG